MKVEIIGADGNNRAFESAENIAANTRMGIQKSWFFVGKQLKSEFNKQVLAKNKTGKIYIRKTKSGARRRHTASAAGQTAANRTGAYRKSIGWNISGDELTFGNSAEYAGFLETGTSRMKARPGLNNSIRASERTIIRTLSSEIESHL